MGEKIIISAPSLDPTKNVSGISSVVNFIIDNNKEFEYVHFEIGRRDNERFGINRVFSIAKAIMTWLKLLNNNPNAIIHYSFPLSTPSIIRDPLFMWIAKMKKHKMVIHIHGGVFLTSKTIPLAIEKIMRWVFSWDVPFIVLSNSEKETLHKRFGAKNVCVLPNCVDLKDAETFVKEESTNPLRLGYFGRIAETKGMKYLLEACVELKKQGIPFILDLAGKEENENEFLPSFESALGDQFHYSGIISGKNKSEYLRKLDVFILPSYFEGLPMSLLECMSYGCVPVTTPVGSIPEVINDGENGVFIKTKDSDTIVKVIKQLNENRLSILKIGLKAKDCIFSNFSPKTYIEELNNIYSQLT